MNVKQIVLTGLMVATLATVARAAPVAHPPNSIFFPTKIGRTLRPDLINAQSGPDRRSVFVNHHLSNNIAISSGFSELDTKNGVKRTADLAIAFRLGPVDLCLGTERVQARTNGKVKADDIFSQELKYNVGNLAATVMNKEGDVTVGLDARLTREITLTLKQQKSNALVGADFKLDKDLTVGVSDDDNKWHANAWYKMKKGSTITVDAYDIGGNGPQRWQIGYRVPLN